MSRLFDITLDCGCMLSADGGGACIPCSYLPDEHQQKICDAAWAKFLESGELDKFNKEVERLNR